jgi:mRNA-degrading endonuclease RelE of RelBE toxin-antitoxin system
MLFIETSVFTKLVTEFLTDDEFLGLQTFLLKYPDFGVIVPGTGGVRKVRWALPGKGKSGGVRVIYYWKAQQNEIWFLTIYKKSEKETIPAHILRQIAKEIDDV